MGQEKLLQLCHLIPQMGYFILMAAQKEIQYINHSHHAPFLPYHHRNPFMTARVFTCLMYALETTHCEGDVHVGQIFCFFLQRVHPQLPLLPAAGSSCPIPFQKTLPPLVRVHLCCSPPPAPCWLSRGHLENEEGVKVGYL